MPRPKFQLKTLLCLSFLLIIGVILPQDSFAQGDPRVSESIRLLREPLRDQADRNRVRELARNFNSDQTEEFTMRVVSLIKSGQDIPSLSTTVILNLYQTVLSAGPNPIFDAYGARVSEALQTALGNLFRVLQNPNTVGGIGQLINVLVDLGIPAPEAREIGEKVFTSLPRIREQQRRSSNAQSRSDDSLTFDAASQSLSFDEDLIVGIELLDGSIDLNDTVIGAEVLIPELFLEDVGDNGVFRFVNLSGDPLSIVGASGEFLTADLEFMLWDGTELIGFGTEVIFSDGVGLPDLGSDYIASMVSALDDVEGFDDHLLLTILPDIDLDTLTSGFTISGTTAFSNSLGLIESGLFSIPEPGSLLLTTQAALLVLGIVTYCRSKTSATIAA